MSSAVEKKHAFAALFGHGATYSFVPIASKVIAIFVVSFYTKWLKTDEMGLSAIVDLNLALFVELLGVSAFQGMVRFYFEHRSQQRRDAVVSSTILLSAVLSVVVTAIALLLPSAFRTFLLTAPKPISAADALLIGREVPVVTWSYVQVAFVLLFLLVPFQMTTQASFKYLQIHRYSALFTSIQLAKMLLELALKIWFVAPFGLGLGVKGMLLSVLVGEVLTTLLLCGWVLRRVGWRIEWPVVRPILGYSWPILVASLCQFALHRSDTKLLEWLLPPDEGLREVGVYSIGYQVGYLANALMLGPFMQIFLPWIYSVEGRKEQAALISRLTSWVLVFYGFATIGLELFAREALLVFDQSKGDEYEHAYRVVPLVGGAYLFWAVYRATIETSFFVAKRTAPLTWFNLAALLVNVGLNTLWIPEHGMIGAAWATLIAFAVLALLGVAGSYRVIGVRLEYGRVAACFTVVAAAGAAAMYVDGSLAEPGRFSALALFVKVCFLAGVAAFLWIGVLTVPERADLSRWLHSKLRRTS